MRWSSRADSRIVEAVISSFVEPAERSYERLSAFEKLAWLRSYHWLDASGMSLYFLDHVMDLGIENALPSEILARLQQNLADNRNRTSDMYEEFTCINQAFQQASVQYSNLKGFTLSPESCPDPTLRCQLDLDFLVDASQLSICREILSGLGYVLAAATATTWEFKAGASVLSSISDLYKSKPQRSVELHFISSTHAPHQLGRDERLDRLSWRSWSGYTFPVLSQADQFLEQACHLFGHICSPHTRLSWLLEYKRHILARYSDTLFWKEVREQSKSHHHTDIAIGVSTLISSQIFGAKAPECLNSWTLDTLPDPVRLWTNQYGRRSVLADFPGTKLYFLLRDELQSDDEIPRDRTRRLLPLHRAPRVTLARSNDSLWTRIRNTIYQGRFVIFRLRFHLIEGHRYAIENVRWKRRRRSLGISRINSTPKKTSPTNAKV
jgi:Uncharacterised nucleotidyltransferase